MKPVVAALAGGLGLGNLLAWGSPGWVHLLASVGCVVVFYLLVVGFQRWAHRYERT